MKGMFKKSFCLFLAVAIGISIAGCGDEAIMKKIEKSGKLVVGTSADYAPYEYHTIINGKDTIVGFDISIVQEISKDLGIQLEIVEMGLEGLLPALNTGDIDIVIAGMNPDEDRKKLADFSKIYYQAKQGVIVRTEDKNKIKTITDLSEKKVGAQLGTEQEKVAKEQIRAVSLVSLGKISELVTQLKKKKIDALVVELPVANEYVKKNNDLALTGIAVKEDTGGVAIAVKKGNSDLVELINKSLDRLMTDGSIKKFVQEASDKYETHKAK
ncbi:MAG TPA: transporter substrate-binding domain-containing protein [Ruminiclostridium sp.]